MSERNLIAFLRTIAVRADVLEALRERSKDEVIATAAAFGLPFTEAEFDRLIWDLEIRLAEKRNEPFDAHFPLWETMWGKHYFDYLVLDMMPSLTDEDVEQVLAAPRAAQGG
jgi:Nif11 domain